MAAPTATTRLPTGMTPRLLSRDAAAAYCGVSAETFETHVPVRALALGARRLWDVKALDRWLDQQSNLGDAVLRPAEEWLGKLRDDRKSARR